MATKPELNADVLSLATEIYDWVDNELEGGIWWERFAKLTEAQKAGLFAQLATEFSDANLETE